MGGEGTQALFDALFIPDVGVHLIKYRQFRAVAGRDMQAGLAHQGQKPDGFQRYSLAPGVRTGHDQQIKIIAESYRDRDHAPLIKQRMPAFPDVDAAFPVQERTAPAHGQGQRAPGKDKVQVCKRPVVGMDLFDILRGLFAQTCQDHLDLFLFFCVELLQVIVQLHDCHRLNEQGGAGGRLVVDQPLHPGAVFGFDRDAVPVSPHGNDGVLETGAQGSVHQTVQSTVDPVVDSGYTAPDVLQRAARVITHFVFRNDASFNLAGK